MMGGVAGGVGGKTWEEGAGFVDGDDFLNVEWVLVAGLGVWFTGDFLAGLDFFAGVLGASFGDALETGFGAANDLFDESLESEVEEPDFLDRMFCQNSFPKLFGGELIFFETFFTDIFSFLINPDFFLM